MTNKSAKGIVLPIRQYYEEDGGLGIRFTYSYPMVVWE